jgi:hypothetical protein
MHAQVVIEEAIPNGKQGVKRLTSDYPTEEKALESAKALVESGLLQVWRRGMSVQALLNQWSALGEEVYVLPDHGEPSFSSTEYARKYAGELTAHGIA